MIRKDYKGLLGRQRDENIKLWRELSGLREELATLKHYRTFNDSLADTINRLLAEKRELANEVRALKEQLAATPVVFEQDELDSSADTLVIDDPNEEREESNEEKVPRLASIVEREEGEEERERAKNPLTRSIAAFFGVV